MSHVCHAIRCETPCRPEYLMCPTHWAMVSSATRAAIYRHYRAGQCYDKRASREWCNAANTAVAEVAKLTGSPMSRHHRRLLEEARATP